MKAVTPTQLRADIYNMLDEVLETGIPLVIRKGKRRLLIVPAEEPDKLRNLVRRPEIILVDPDELPAISWEHEVNLDLP